MAIASDLKAQTKATLTQDKVEEVYNLFLDRLSELAINGQSMAKLSFPIWLTQAERTSIETSLKAEGFGVVQNTRTGFLEVSWL